MKRIYWALIFITSLFVGCQKNETLLQPNDFCDFAVGSSSFSDGEDAVNYIAIGDFVSFMDLSKGATMSNWTISEGCFFLSSEISSSTVDFTPYIIEGSQSSDTTVHIYFPESGKYIVTFSALFPEEQVYNPTGVEEEMVKSEWNEEMGGHLLKLDYIFEVISDNIDFGYKIFIDEETEPILSVTTSGTETYSDKVSNGTVEILETQKLRIEYGDFVGMPENPELAHFNYKELLASCKTSVTASEEDYTHNVNVSFTEVSAKAQAMGSISLTREDTQTENEEGAIAVANIKKSIPLNVKVNPSEKIALDYTILKADGEDVTNTSTLMLNKGEALTLSFTNVEGLPNDFDYSGLNGTDIVVGQTPTPDDYEYNITIQYPTICDEFEMGSIVVKRLDANNEQIGEAKTITLTNKITVQEAQATPITFDSSRAIATDGATVSFALTSLGDISVEGTESRFSMVYSNTNKGAVAQTIGCSAIAVDNTTKIVTLTLSEPLYADDSDVVLKYDASDSSTATVIDGNGGGKLEELNEVVDMSQFKLVVLSDINNNHYGFENSAASTNPTTHGWSTGNKTKDYWSVVEGISDDFCARFEAVGAVKALFKPNTDGVMAAIEPATDYKITFRVYVNSGSAIKDVSTIEVTLPFADGGKVNVDIMTDTPFDTWQTKSIDVTSLADIDEAKKYIQLYVPPYQTGTVLYFDDITLYKASKRP